jgi:hypothetical protein
MLIAPAGLGGDQITDDIGEIQANQRAGGVVSAASAKNVRPAGATILKTVMDFVPWWND